MLTIHFGIYTEYLFTVQIHAKATIKHIQATINSGFVLLLIIALQMIVKSSG